MRYRRWPWIAAAGVVMAAIGWTAVNCIPPESFRAVKEPRAGRVMNDRVAIVYSAHYQINLGGLEKLHPFDIHKYARIYLKLNTDGLLRPEDVFVPEQVTREQILLVQTPEFLAGLKDPKTVARYLEAPVVAGLPKGALDGGILKPFRYATGGTILAGRLALKHGIAVNLAGGYHHAKPDRGEGFNIYADMAIAIRALQKEKLIHRALVVDLDVHQGNGTAVIFAGDDDVFTFSMHEGGIYPVPKETSDLDVELPAGTDDDRYMALLVEHLPDALSRAKADIVFLQAGCDTLKGDPLAHLAMTHAGIVRRDATVIDACVKLGLPVVMVLGGGYSKGAWKAQYHSVARTIRQYGLAPGERRAPPRSPSAKEKLFTK